MKRLIAVGACVAAAAFVPLAGIPAMTRVAAAQNDDSRAVAGKKLTADTCANDHCHGGSAPSFDDMKGVTEARIRKVIAEGLPGSGMPAFRGVFSPEQVDDIVAYVLSAASGSPAAPEPAHAPTVRRNGIVPVAGHSPKADAWTSR